MRYPHTKLFNYARRIIVLSGPHIQVLDSLTGLVLYSTAKDSPKNLIDNGPIRCSGMSRDGRYLATAGDDKRLKIWDVESLTLLSERDLPKKPTCIEFSGNANIHILVSDKFGDIFRYTLYPGDMPVEEMPASAVPAVRGELILGHASLLTSFLLSPDEKFIITADRDEHIRISWYPEGHVIQSFCLDHKKYVSAIHILAASPAKLISGGGDFELKIWDWMTGRLQQNITVYPAVEPFINVTVQSKRRNNVSLGTNDSGVQSPSPAFDAPSDHIFVVHRIDSFPSSCGNHVVFSVIGATAIFAFILTEAENRPDIRHYDFGKPVIDFTICGEGTIWVLLDADFREVSNIGYERTCKLVQAVRWSTSGFTDASCSALLDSLNTTCSLPATVEDLQALDLYSALSTLPKTIDREQESRVDSLEDESTGKGTFAIGLTKRALGRLKHKRALGQLHHEEEDGHDRSGLFTKRVKANPENEESHSTKV